MSFDFKKFKNAERSCRTEEVPVPELIDFFEKDENPVWTIRNLKGTELGRINEVGDKYKRVDSMVKAVVDAAGGSGKELVKSFKEQLGVSDKLSEDLARRTEMLMIGSVNPVCDIETAATLREDHYSVFRRLTDKLYILSGKGSQLGKPEGSGDKKESEQA